MYSKIEVSFTQDEKGGYIYLPGHPGKSSPGCSEKNVRLHDLITYTGQDIYFDLDAKGKLIGIEIVN